MAKEGMLLQMDGSHHKWNGKDTWVLIGIIDDATSEITSAKFFEGETTFGCMETLCKTIAKKGIPLSVYTDKAGVYGGNKRQDFSQFERACSELGITVLYAHSPQANGRIERAWRTFQDRLIPELRLKEKLTIKAANDYLETQFIPKYWNTHNTIPAQEKESYYKKLPGRLDLEQIFCTKERRVIANDIPFSTNRNATQSKTNLCLVGPVTKLRFEATQTDNGVPIMVQDVWIF